jgi:hypothetical protein
MDVGLKTPASYSIPYMCRRVKLDKPDVPSRINTANKTNQRSQYWQNKDKLNTN